VASALYTDVCLKGKGRLAGSRGGLGSASSCCLRGDPQLSSRAGFLSRSGVADVFTKFCLQKGFHPSRGSTAR